MSDLNDRLTVLMEADPSAAIAELERIGNMAERSPDHDEKESE